MGHSLPTTVVYLGWDTLDTRFTVGHAFPPPFLPGFVPNVPPPGRLGGVLTTVLPHPGRLEGVNHCFTHPGRPEGGINHCFTHPGRPERRD